MKRNVIWVAALALAVTVPGAANAAQKPTASKTPVMKSGTHGGSTGAAVKGGTKSGKRSGSKSSLSSADRTFINKAAQGGVAEVTLGKLAQKKAKSAEVKDFGSRMVTDHSKANQELLSIASKKGVKPPKTMPADAKAMQAKLSKLSGEAFDRAYMQGMVKDHTKDSAEFHKEASKGQDSDVKTFATNTSKVIDEHLQMAKKIAANEKSPAHAGKGKK